MGPFFRTFYVIHRESTNTYVSKGDRDPRTHRRGWTSTHAYDKVHLFETRAAADRVLSSAFWDAWKVIEVRAKVAMASDPGALLPA